MAVHSFATNNLVKERDVYVRYIKAREEYIKENNIHPEPHLFIKRKHLLNSINIDNMPFTSLQRAICKWHCMQLTYHIWHDLASKCRVYNGTIGHKKTVHIPDDILKEFKKKVEKAIIDNNCDYNRKLPHSKCVYDACRYLAMYWTYLDIVKDEVSQRFYPDPDTWKRAAKIFGYDKDENPFQMNGTYFDWKQKNEDETKMEEVNDDILEKNLEDLGFSVRTEACLYRAGVWKFKGLLMLTANDILHIRNIGINSFREVVSKLQEYGYTYPEDKTDARIPYVKDRLPIKKQSEESVIDIAEEAAKKVEEEEKLVAHDHSYVIPDEDVKVLAGLGKRLEKIDLGMDDIRANAAAKSTCVMLDKRIDELRDNTSKNFSEINGDINKLDNKITRSFKELYELIQRRSSEHTVMPPQPHKPSDDILSLCDQIVGIMKKSSMEEFCMKGEWVIDIHKKSEMGRATITYR